MSGKLDTYSISFILDADVQAGAGQLGNARSTIKSEADKPSAISLALNLIPTTTVLDKLVTSLIYSFG